MYISMCMDAAQACSCGLNSIIVKWVFFLVITLQHQSNFAVSTSSCKQNVAYVLEDKSWFLVAKLASH